MSTTDPTCDRCDRPATIIMRVERPNTGVLIAYWCDQHNPARHLVRSETDTDEP